MIILGFLDGLRPTIIKSVSKWADENVWLSSESSAEPGKYNSKRTPYMIEIMDALSTNSPVQEVIFMKGVQIAGTQAGLNIVGCYADISPRPIMYVMPTVETAKMLSNTKLNSIIEHSPALRNKISDAKEKNGGNTKLYKEFPGGFIRLSGANSASSLRSSSIGLMILDEVDAYPADVDGEGSPVSLAKKRLITFGDRKKMFMLSTPLIEGHSVIEREFLKTDQRYYHVPCPHCERKQDLMFDYLKWEPGNFEKVQYQCSFCSQLIDEWYKTRILNEGEWISMKPENSSSTKRGYHLNSLYSPLGWMSWADIAKDYEEKAMKDVNELRVFTNTILAQTFTEMGESPDWEKLYNRRENYVRNIVPKSVAFLTAGVDIQGDRIELEIVGWCDNKISYSIDYRVLLGDTSGSEVWDRLEQVVYEKFQREDGFFMPILMMAVDSGNNTQVVYSFCSRFGGVSVIPVKGQDAQRTIVKAPSSVNYMHDGKKIGGVKLWNVGVSLLKSELYGFLKQRIKDDGLVPTGYCHFPEYGEEYFKMLTAEQLKYVINNKGQSVATWIKPSGKRNEALDCRNYARAAASIVGLDVMTSNNFIEMINSYEPAVPVSKVKKIKPSEFWDKK